MKENFLTIATKGTSFISERMGKNCICKLIVWISFPLFQLILFFKLLTNDNFVIAIVQKILNRQKTISFIRRKLFLEWKSYFN